MIKHVRDEKNPVTNKRLEILKKWKDRIRNDGLNSLSASVEQVVKYFTHTRLYIKIVHVKS